MFSIYGDAAAGREEHRCLRGGRDGEVPQPEGRAGGAAREAHRRRQVGGVQQVIVFMTHDSWFHVQQLIS